MRGVRAFGALVGLTALVAVGAASAGATTGVADPPPQADRGLVDARVCGPPTPGTASCHAHVLARPDGHGGVTPAVTPDPAGLHPDQVTRAYNVPTAFSGSTTPTIAIVDAYDAPNIEADLATFSSQLSLPPCTTANGCFTKVNQSGTAGPYPRADSGWALEIALDVEWAHAIAPTAKIVLVEATSNSFDDLLTAERWAAANAGYVSNSWGAPEFSGETTYDTSFTGSFGGRTTSFFVSAGDNGTPAEYPSSSRNVLSVGGTTLNLNADGTVASETGWSGGGGGCSAYESALTSQQPFSTWLCGSKRATPDVSLVADPNTGVSVYSTDGASGWVVVGGTSASAPMWAARSALTGSPVNAATVYANTVITYRDITSGNNGAACLPGFDLCTGRGSWLTGGTPPSPTASIPKASCSGATCTFYGAANDSSVSPSWTFGDTSSAAGQWSVSHKYGPGTTTYTVTLTITGGNTASRTVSCSTVTRGKKTTTNCTVA
jgi:subtilase family serine protease